LIASFSQNERCLIISLDYDIAQENTVAMPRNQLFTTQKENRILVVEDNLLIGDKK
jgi:hypothetical protein